MKIVTICGSPRKRGNTDRILSEFEKQFDSRKGMNVKNKRFNVAEMNIHSCRSCLKCAKKNSCVLNDDFAKISRRMVDCDLIIIGSPVYFSDVSAPVKALFDRTFSLWHAKLLKGKDVILVATCAEMGTGHTIDTMRHWAKDHEMNVIATIEGMNEKKGEVLENTMTRKAISDAVRVCEGLAEK